MEIMKTITIGNDTYEIADEKVRKALENGGVIVAVVTSTDPVTGRVTHTCTLSNGETFTVGDGASGVYIGTGTPPANATVWINPIGEPTATEDWEFDLEDGNTDTKTVVVIGSDDAANQGKVAILRMKDADGNWVEIPAIKGFDPKVEISKSGKVTTVKITTSEGVKIATINDGFDPKVSVTKSGKVTTITITDADGDKTVTLNDGVDITKVEQTTTSTEDGGTNVVTVSLSNGSQFTFNVKNGSKGSKGDTGTSVTVAKVTESTEDGGSNVVEFSDGNSLNVKNGSKGNGYAYITRAAGALELSVLKGFIGTTRTFSNTSDFNGKVGDFVNIPFSVTDSGGALSFVVMQVTEFTSTSVTGKICNLVYAPQGPIGDTGAPGADGNDYVITDADKAEIADDVKGSLITETWKFTLADGATVTKAVCVG